MRIQPAAFFMLRVRAHPRFAGLPSPRKLFGRWDLLFVVFLAFKFLTVFSFAQTLRVGDAAPLVSGPSETGSIVKFEDVYKANKYTLVYFYPRAGTSGCTAQGCSLRDAYEELTKKGVAVIGVSTDSVAKQAEFKKENHFQFTLIADPEKTIINAFGVGSLKLPFLGTMAHRRAYLVKDGKIIYADTEGSTSKQAQDVLNVLKREGS